MWEEVLDFWFEEIDPKKWWTKDNVFDELIRNRFGTLHGQAAQAECWTWRTSAKGRLAEIIVLDQFSRNLYRDSPKAFAADPMALALAQEAVAGKWDTQLTNVERNFLYMPYMHSESALIHEQAVKLFSANNRPDNLDFEYKHKAIIDRFGRYPHRNKVLGRDSTAEELEFLESNSGF